MEIKVVLDTNRLTDLFRGDASLAADLGKCDEVLIPVFVLAEIMAGFEGGGQHAKNELLLRNFLAKPTVEVLYPGRETAAHYARLFNQLRKAGTPIPHNGLWIAALTLEHNAILITRDRHFDRIPQLDWRSAIGA